MALSMLAGVISGCGNFTPAPIIAEEYQKPFTTTYKNGDVIYTPGVTYAIADEEKAVKSSNLL